MNLVTAALVIVVGTVVAVLPMPQPPFKFEARWEPVKEIPKPRELTFEERWEPVRQLPQMLRQENNLIEPRIIPVRTISIRKEDVVPAVHVEQVEVAAAEEIPLPVPRPQPRVRSIRKAQLDICQRHGMHRVDYGRRWRCRR